MAKYRNISMGIWNDSKVLDDFTPEDRLVFVYCLTNSRTNLCGCYEISVRQMANEIGYSEDSVMNAVKRLDTYHNVLRFSRATSELLVLNWHRYNWSTSGKLNSPLLEEIRAIKNNTFREYLANWYNSRDSVDETYNPEDDFREEETKDRSESPVPPKKRRSKKADIPRKKYGEFGWVLLSDAEYSRLLNELGQQELTRCITYVDESAQKTSNKNGWKDWNLVVRQCHRNGWGLEHQQRGTSSNSGSAFDTLAALHQQYSEDET